MIANIGFDNNKDDEYDNDECDNNENFKYF